jgi:hypothetical protein
MYEIQEDPSLKTTAQKNQCIKDELEGKSVVAQFG